MTLEYGPGRTIYTHHTVKKSIYGSFSQSCFTQIEFSEGMGSDISGFQWYILVMQARLTSISKV